VVDYGMTVVDSDIHPIYPSAAMLRPYLRDRWQEFLDTSRFQAAPGFADAYPSGAATTTLADAALPPGSTAAVGLQRMREQALDKWSTDHAILSLYYGIESLRNPDWADALTSAVNDWLIGEWLDKDTRLHANMQVQAQYPDLAAREIERIGKHPGIVGVFLPVRSERPYGNRSYDPLFEAASRHNLVLGIHFGGETGNPPTSVGWPTYYFEQYVNMSTIFQTQVTSMVIEGVFERFPTLRVALLEGGWTWLPSLLWRLDKEWRGLRRETPWIGRLPSECIRDNFRASLQPIDSPPTVSLLLKTLEQIRSEEFLMFSTDYPHNHGNELEEFLSIVPSALREKIMGSNASAFYDLKQAPA
jgi:uncharacterized protein